MTLSVDLRHRFAGAEIDIGFSAPVPGLTILFGPSGAGKSTVVASIAGLLRPEMCRIELNGNVLADTDTGVWTEPERRGAGMVFQDARLFPHLSVGGNLQYGLRRAGAGPFAFDDIVGLLGIEHLIDRRPHTLSGGERQRIAIGRALLSQPRLLLMDEPLASLDHDRKAEILPYLIRIRDEMAIPILYVTHSMEEVARLADAVVLLEKGRVVASGALTEITARSDLAIARRDDAASILVGTVAGHLADRQLSEVLVGSRRLFVPLLDAPVGASVRLGIPAREVILALEAPSAISVHNIIDGAVRSVAVDAIHHDALVEVAIPGGAFLARVTPDAVSRLQLTSGVPVLALIKSVAIQVIGLGGH